MKNFSAHRAPWRRLPHALLTALAWLAALGAHAQAAADDLTAAWLGTIDQTTQTVSGLPANGRVAQLLSASTAAAGATIKVVNSAGQSVPKTALLTGGMSILVTAPTGAQKTYALNPNGAALPVENLNNVPSSTQASITNRVLRISGSSELRITGSNPLRGTAIDLQGEDVWLYFEGVRPSKFARQLLAHVTVNGQRAQIDTTVRLVQYLQGCVLISQPRTYQPLEAHDGASLGGTAKKFNLYTYYKAPELGAFNNTIASFRLKKGYMATFAENEDGTGTSKVYIAPDNDVVVNALPANLQGKVSMVRVFPWRWTHKKGFCSAPVLSDSLYASWNYDWNNGAQSTLDREYVPIRQTQYWPAFATTNAKQNVTHFLGFNEPDASSQANMTVKQAIAAWPGLMQSGLRVGSPAPTDGGANWLYQFMDKADSAGYRVDFVAVHFYRGCQSPQQFYNFLKAVHDRTRRPIWITEWNNGANWTTSTGCPKPTYAEQAAKIQAFVQMLDTTRFVERYSLYQWVQDTRKLFVNDGDPGSITPAGIVYRDKVSPMAYNPNFVLPTVNVPVPVPFGRGNLVVTRYGNSSWTGGTGVTLPAYVDEFAPTNGPLYSAGQLMRSVAIPTANYGGNFGFVGSAMKANVDGTIGISPDRTRMAIAGFNAGINSSNANGGTSPRVVAVLDADGNLDTRTGFSDGNGNPLRTATVTDSATVYIAYGANNLGLKHASQPATSTATPRTRTGTTIFPTISLKKMAVYEGQLYFTQTTNGNAKLMKLSGLPSQRATPTGLPGLPLMASGGLQPGGFALFDVNPAVPGFDLLYYTDDAASSVLNKYTFDGTTWTARGAFTITGLNDNLLRDLTGTLVRGIPTLYAVSYTSLVRIEDTATRYTPANANFTSSLSTATTTLTVLKNNAASTAYAYRGVAFSPGTRDSLYVRVPQTITFNAIADQALGTPSFYAGATSSSGLEIGYASSDLNVATVNNGLISLVGPGTVTITASQPGDFKYLGAAPVARTFTVLSDLTVAAGQKMTMSAAGSYGNVLVQGELVLSAPLVAGGTITVARGGVLSTNCQPITGAAAFTVASGAELRVCDVAGLAPTGVMSGAVQTTGSRTFSPDASYMYSGNQAQATGAGLPSQVRNLLVNNPAGLTLSAPLTVMQVLRLTQGNLTLGNQLLTLHSDATGTALVDNTGGVVNGTATVQRYLDPSLNSGLGYRHYSAPVTNTTVADLATGSFAPIVNPAYNTSATPGTTTPFPTVFGYAQGRLTSTSNNLGAFDKGWYSPATTSDVLTPGQGYTVNIGANQLVDFRGTLGNGSLTVNASRGTDAQAGWALLGNPYPAPLDLSQVTATDRPGLDAAVYVVQSTGQYTGGYRAYVNGQSTTGANNPLLATAQGFFVRVSSGQPTGSFTFRNAQRVTDYAAAQRTSFQRTTADHRPTLRLVLAGNGFADGWVTYAESGAGRSFDREFDAAKLPNPSGLNLSSLGGTERLAIDGQAQFTTATVLPLQVGVPAAGSYTLTAAALDNLPAGLTAYLRDAATGQTLPLSQGASYNFSVSATQAATLLTGRFMVQFAPAAPLVVTPATLAAAITIYPNPATADAGVTVALPGLPGSHEVRAEILNALGQVAMRRTAALPASGTTLELPTTGLVQGVYLVRLTVGETTVVKRLTIQ